VKVVIAVPRRLRELLDARVQVEEGWERQWVTWQRQEARKLPTAAERRNALAAVTAARDRLHEAGVLLGSASAVVSHHLRLLLADAGLAGLPPLPAGYGSLPGRRWGSSRRGGQARLTLALADDVADLARRAGYHLSAAGTQILQANADRRDSGRAAPEQIGTLVDAFHRLSGPELAAAVRQAVGAVITVGDLVRAAAWRSVDAQPGALDDLPSVPGGRPCDDMMTIAVWQSRIRDRYAAAEAQISNLYR
jgi:hypothetical protein